MPRALRAAMRSTSSERTVAAVATPSILTAVMRSGPGAGRRETRVERVAVGELQHTGTESRDIRSRLEGRGDDVGDLGELLVAESARRQRCRADAHAGGGHRR